LGAEMNQRQRKWGGGGVNAPWKESKVFATMANIEKKKIRGGVGFSKSWGKGGWRQIIFGLGSPRRERKNDVRGQKPRPINWGWERWCRGGVCSKSAQATGWEEKERSPSLLKRTTGEMEPILKLIETGKTQNIGKKNKKFWEDPKNLRTGYGGKKTALYQKDGE